jgi:predicted esterase YcpF (UPF0227 family)
LTGDTYGFGAISPSFNHDANSLSGKEFQARHPHEDVWIHHVKEKRMKLLKSDKALLQQLEHRRRQLIGLRQDRR